MLSGPSNPQCWVSVDCLADDYKMSRLSGHSPHYAVTLAPDIDDTGHSGVSVSQSEANTD